MRQRFLFLVVLLIGQLSKATPLAESVEWKSVHDMTHKAYGDWIERLYNNSLPLSRQSRFAFSYLPPQEGFLDKQIALGRKIKEHFKDVPAAAEKHDPLWALWGLLLLYTTDVRPSGRMTSGFENAHCKKIQEQFLTEVSERIANKETTYTWFSLFALRLTFLSRQATHDSSHSFGEFNTLCGAYIDGLRGGSPTSPHWHKHDTTLWYLETAGDLKTRTELSPMVDIKRFPDIVITPYLFSLSILEMAENRTCPNQPSWFAAFCQYDCRADGGELGQPLAYMHDLQHLAHNRLKPRTVAFIVDEAEVQHFLLPQILLEFQGLMQKGRELAETIFGKISHKIKECSDPIRRKMEAFWLFVHDHEGLQNVIIALSSLFSDVVGLGVHPIDLEKNSFHQPTYYLSEMSENIQGMSREDRVKALRDDFAFFKNRLSTDYLNQNDLELVKKFFNYINSLSNKIGHTTGKCLNFYKPGMLHYTTFLNLGTLRDGVMYYKNAPLFESLSYIILHPENEFCPVAIVKNQTQ